VSVAAVVLAAGASRRLGRPKQTVEIGGETLLARAVRVAREARLDPVIVVVADPALAQLLRPGGVTVLLNLDASEGIASSIRVGIAGAKRLDVSGAILMTCDQVAVTADHLCSLCARPEFAAGSAYAGAIGIPAYFPVAAFENLLQLQGDRGARDLLQDARSVATEALNLDVDTEEDFQRARQLLENERLS
jgi:CTP:molybdopterin cytidylyltransferase MocA